MSRAAWLVVASSAAAAASVATLAACSGNDAKSGPGATTGGETAGDAAPGDAAPGDAAPSDAAPDVIADAGPMFACGDAACAVATEYCHVERTHSCSGNPPPLVTSACAPLAADFPACAASPRCACITPLLPEAGSDDNGNSWASLCVDDGGGVEVDDIWGHCAGCYGAPPARLERLAAV